MSGETAAIDSKLVKKSAIRIDEIIPEDKLCQISMNRVCLHCARKYFRQLPKFYTIPDRIDATKLNVGQVLEVVDKLDSNNDLCLTLKEWNKMCY